MTIKTSKQENVNRAVSVPTKSHQTPLEASTEFLLKPSFLAAKVIDSDKKQLSKEWVDLQYTQAMLERSIGEVKQGNLADIEAMLYSQSYALNVMFTTLMTRANRQEYMPPTQALMSLAFKAQNQSRATLQALIGLKQPSQTTFVKQANISQGHQQVNNLAEKNENLQNKLLEGQAYDLDRRPQATAARTNSNMEAVGEVHRGKDSRRQVKGIKKCN
jgi:hypothetical protein